MCIIILTQKLFIERFEKKTVLQSLDFIDVSGLI